jgi:thiosulfate dehydrogenase [quinone] large subunit
MNALKTPSITGLLWLVARLWLGYEWLLHGIDKVVGAGAAKWVGADAGAGVAGFLKGAIAKSPLGEGFDPATTPHPAVAEWFAMLARDVFLPNAQLMGYMVAYGELLVGVALLVGIFTRFSALMGGAMALAFLLAGSTSGGLPILLTVALAIAVGGKTAGVYGLDFFAQPIEAKLFQRVFAQGTPAATPHTA